MKSKKTIIIVMLALILIPGLLLLVLSPPNFLTFGYIKSQALAVQHTASVHYLATFGALVLIHAIGMLVGIPIKGIFNIVAGSLLGVAFGCIATVLGVYLGTSVLFFLTRHLFRSRYEKLAGAYLKKFEHKINATPIRTMAGLRLLITLPFGPVTIGAALTRISYGRFLIGSILGDLPVIVFYAVAGQQLATMNSSSDAIKPHTIAILISVAVLLLASTFIKKKEVTAATLNDLSDNDPESD